MAIVEMKAVLAYASFLFSSHCFLIFFLIPTQHPRC